MPMYGTPSMLKFGTWRGWENILLRICELILILWMHWNIQGAPTCF